MLLLTFDLARIGAGVKPTPTGIFPSSAGCKLATFSRGFLFPQVCLRPFAHTALPFPQAGQGLGKERIGSAA